MPSSGARSGTRPSRRSRGAGDGKIGPNTVTLSCGHTTNRPPLTSGAKTLYSCPEGCGLKAAK
jgi:hypothetical protein